MSSHNKRSRKYLLWTRLQLISLGAFLVSIVLCFILTRWFLLLALLFLIISAIAHRKRMLSISKDPSTKEINEEV